VYSQRVNVLDEIQITEAIADVTKDMLTAPLPRDGL
jgi:hypothetical protein